MNEREFALQLFQAALPVSQQMQEIYEEIVRLQQTIEQEKALEQSELTSKKKKLLLPVKLIGGAGVLAGYVAHARGSETGMFLFYFIGAIAALVYYLLVAKPAISQLQPDLRHRRNMEGIADRIETCQMELDQIYRDNEQILQHIPEDYHYQEAIDFFLRAVRNRRADSVKEAINLYEDYLYKQEMAANMQRQHEQQIAALREISTEASRAANNAAAAASAAALGVLSGNSRK